MEILLAKGMRDFSPQEKISRDQLTTMLKEQFEIFGFNPLETPILERFEVLSAKYAGGAEILKETFRLTDQGERELGLRYDLTVPLARYIASNPNVKLPFKRYAIDRVYRDGPIKLGRYREFYQCDCDIVGANTAAADAQCIQLAISVFDRIGMQYRIDVNHVALLKRMLLQDGVRDEKLIDAMLVLDKLKKIGENGVHAELEAIGVPGSATTRIIAIAELKTNIEKINAIREAYGQGADLDRIQQVLELCSSDKVVFDPSLSRGLSYYTGMVFETYFPGSAVTSSVSGGGRYDKMIGAFCGKEEDYPAVGISFGLEPITEALKANGENGKMCVTDAYIIPIKTQKESNEIVQELRQSGIRADIDIMERGLSKNLDYASTMGIPYVIFVGKKELDEGKVKLRNMQTGSEEMLTVKEAKAKLHAAK